MNAEQLQAAAFEIILASGNGRTITHEAFKLMREGNFEEAEAKLDEANSAFVEAHNAQTELLQAYASGEELVMEIIMIHAQDHLMTGMTLREVAIEMLELYKRVG